MQSKIFIFECDDPSDLKEYIGDILIEECLITNGERVTSEIILSQNARQKKFIMLFSYEGLYCPFPFEEEDILPALEEKYTELYYAEELDLLFKRALVLQDRIIIQFHEDNRPYTFN